MWLRLVLNRRGVTSLEYGLIAGVLVVLVAAGFNTLGSGINHRFTNIAAKLT